jgi:hypothetical protein
MNAASRRLDPYNDSILVAEFHKDEPQSVITENRTYDFFQTAEHGTIYNNSGSGLRGMTYKPGQLAGGGQTVLWAAEGVTLVDNQGQPLSDEALAKMGYTRAEMLPDGNLFDSATEDKATFCEITKAWWGYENPSPYIRWMENAGVWAGCGDTTEFKREDVARSLADLAILMGTRTTRLVMDALLAMDDTKREITIDRDNHDQTFCVTLHDGGSVLALTFKADDEMLAKVEAGIAWLETVDGDRAYGEAIEAHNMLLRAVRAMDFIHAAIRGTPVPSPMRMLWKAVKRQAITAGNDEGVELIRAFIETARK